MLGGHAHETNRIATHPREAESSKGSRPLWLNSVKSPLKMSLFTNLRTSNVDVARRKYSLSISPSSHHPQPHGRSDRFNALRNVPDSGPVLDHRINPFILKPVRQLPKDREDAWRALSLP